MYYFVMIAVNVRIINYLHIQQVRLQNYYELRSAFCRGFLVWSSQHFASVYQCHSQQIVVWCIFSKHVLLAIHKAFELWSFCFWETCPVSGRAECDFHGRPSGTSPVSDLRKNRTARTGQIPGEEPLKGLYRPSQLWVCLSETNGRAIRHASNCFRCLVTSVRK